MITAKLYIVYRGKQSLGFLFSDNFSAFTWENCKILLHCFIFPWHLEHDKVLHEMNICTSKSHKVRKITKCTMFSWTCLEEQRLWCTRKLYFSSPEMGCLQLHVTLFYLSSNSVSTRCLHLSVLKGFSWCYLACLHC